MKKYIIVAIVAVMAILGLSLHIYGDYREDKGRDAVWSKIDHGLAQASEEEATWSDIDGDGYTNITWFRDGETISVKGPNEMVGQLIWCYEWLIPKAEHSGCISQ